MSKQRMVSTRFWSDNWVVDELNPLDRYLFLYLLTNEHTNVGGIYEMSLRTMSNETGIEAEELKRMLKRLESRVIFQDGWVVFKKAIQHQNIGSPKIKSAIAQTLKILPPALLEYVLVPSDFGDLLKQEYGIDMVSIPYDYPMDTVSHSNSNININSNLNSNSNLNPNSNTKLAKASRALKSAEADNETKTRSADIDAMFERWESVVGFPINGKKAGNRRACSNLLKAHGPENLERLMAGVALALNDKFAPRISDFCSLESKQNDLIVWGRKKGVNNAVAQF